MIKSNHWDYIWEHKCFIELSPDHQRGHLQTHQELESVPKSGREEEGCRGTPGTTLIILWGSE